MTVPSKCPTCGREMLENSATDEVSVPVDLAQRSPVKTDGLDAAGSHSGAETPSEEASEQEFMPGLWRVW